MDTRDADAPAGRSRFRPGDRFNDFEVIERLGSGSYGTVYACKWAIDNNNYAVKVLDGSIANARREYLALREIRHTNVVHCLHAGRADGGGWYIQFELAEGEPLSVPVRSGQRLAPDAAVPVVQQLLAGLEAIHPNVDRINELSAKSELSAEEYAELAALEESGLIHRDVKPENLIATPQGRLVLVDFGISSMSGSSIETQSATTAYLPPDFSFLPGDRWRPDLDLYAAGVVCYELICGCHPYAASEYGTGPKHPPTDVPRPLAAWLLRACASRRNDRYPSAPSMAAALAGAFPAGRLVAQTASPRIDQEVVARLAEHVDDATSNRVPAVSPPTFAVPADAKLSPEVTSRIQEELGIEAYDGWSPTSVTVSDDAALERLVLDVVAVETPVRCARIYRQIASALGTTESALRSRLNRLVYAMVRSGKVAQVEALGGGQVDKTLIDPKRAPRVRELGPRTPWEMPKVELAELVRRLINDDDEILEAVTDDPALVLELTADVLGVDRASYEERYLQSLIDDIVRDLPGL